MLKVKSAAKDMAINIAATLIPTAALQLLVLPVAARGMSDDSYGLALAVIALLGVCPLTVGNVINNIRLLKDEEYRKGGEKGDFSAIVLASCVANCIVIFLGALAIGGQGAFGIALVVLASVMMLCREYLVAEFRLKLDYKGILVTNLLQTCGMMVGLGIHMLTGYWACIYLIGYGASIAYLLFATEIWRDPVCVTNRMKETLGAFASLGIANILNKLTAYADRLVLIPLAGAGNVAVYYIACLFGKILSLLISPINNVLLSYLVKEDKASDKAFWASLGVGALLCVVGYIVTMLLAYPFLQILYPQFVDAAMSFIPVTTAAAYLMVLSGIAGPFVMRFCDLRWQIVLNGCFCAVFFIGSIIGFYFAGLMGFCVGVLVANGVRVICVVAIYTKKSK